MAVKINEKRTHINPFWLEEKTSMHVDLNENADNWSRALFPLFMRAEVAKEIHFNTNLKYEYIKASLAEIFATVTEYELISSVAELHSAGDTDYYNYPPIYEKDWYVDELNAFEEIVLNIRDKNNVNQRILIDFIRTHFSANRADRNKNLFIGNELVEYRKQLHQILQKVDDRIISGIKGEYNECKPSRSEFFLVYTLLCIKYDTDNINISPKKVKKGNREYYQFVMDNGTIVAISSNIAASIRAINLNKRCLEFDVEIKNLYFAEKNMFDIKVISDSGEEIETHQNDIYSLHKYFGKNVYKSMTLDFKIPIEGVNKSRYTVRLRYKDAEFRLPLNFSKPQSRLNIHQKHGYWRVAGMTLRYVREKEALELTKEGSLKTAVREISYWRDILSNCGNTKRAIAFIGLRTLYFLTRPFYSKKNVWVTFDQLFKGGDNGEYFYKYVSELNNKDQTIYYVVNKDTKEYKELSSKYKTVLIYRSLKHKLVSLHSRIVFTTRADETQYLGFAKSAEIYFRNLFNYDAVCLQHGLSIQQIAQYQNRVYDNLKYYFCVSKYEIANLSKPIYGFEDKSMLALTGAPRYDGLVGKPKRQIIITPTWRRNVTAGTNKKGSNHVYSENFKNTKYFEIYNSLINDKKLIECAEETGYRLIYLIHPILSPQINDFEKNDYLEILPGADVNYEKILVESALMLTDHSGIMYDFAYQRKPLVYYHPDELPPQYAAGGLDYETMGFGPVCKTHGEVVDALCNFMRNDCRLENMYRERIEDFFAFDDQNNCKRVYEAAKVFEQRMAEAHR